MDRLLTLGYRCARNCFQCPICQNTLSVVAAQEPTPSSTPATAGPYFLFCNVCRWNSKEVNMTFEKPTSLACKFHNMRMIQGDQADMLFSATTKDGGSITRRQRV